MSLLKAGGDIVRSVAINSAVSASCTPSVAFSSADATTEIMPRAVDALCAVRDGNRIEADGLPRGFVKEGFTLA